MRKAIETIVRQQFTSVDERNKVLADIRSIRGAARRILATLNYKIDGGDMDDDYAELCGAVMEIEEDAADIMGRVKELNKVVN
jgi:hypothetical protein